MFTGGNYQASGGAASVKIDLVNPARVDFVSNGSSYVEINNAGAGGKTAAFVQEAPDGTVEISVVRDGVTVHQHTTPAEETA